MTDSAPEIRSDPPKPVRKVLIVLAIAAMALVFGVALFVPAGRLDWTPGWIYLGLVVLYTVSAWACLLRWNPELADRRMRVGEGTKTWDKVWAVLFGPTMLGIYVVAGLEARSGGASIDWPLWSVGLAVFVLGSFVLNWSMVVNPFFEKTVRIQTDRGQYVIDTGPYAYVRHPGYVGFLGWLVASPPLLGSVWAWVPASVAVVLLVARTALEDRTLMRELSGYPEYAARVRFRLIPGVW